MHKIEEIPNDAELYRRVHPKSFNPKKRKIDLSAFILREGEIALSVNWDKYSTPEKTAVCPKSGKKFYVGGLFAEIPRREQLEVKHHPNRNRSHSLITGDNLINEETKYHTAFVLAENCRPIITEIK